MEENDNKFGDFEEIKEEEKDSKQQPQVEEVKPQRVRRLREGQVIGKITQRYGGNRMEIRGTDGKLRNCRVPGRYKRRLWLRPGDIVIIEPWKDDDSKGDVVYKFYPNEINQLRKSGIMDSLKDEF